VLDIDAAEQSELSLIENIIRLDMTPTDEIRAYKHFVGEGSDLDAIAKRFGRHGGSSRAVCGSQISPIRSSPRSRKARSRSTSPRPTRRAQP
jgi:hypothetical protein